MRLAGKQVIDQPVNGLNFEEKRAADVGQHVAQAAGKLHHQNRVDTVALERFSRRNLAGWDAYCFADQHTEIDASFATNGVRMSCSVHWQWHQNWRWQDSRLRRGGVRCRLTHHTIAFTHDDLLTHAVRRFGGENHLAESFLLQDFLPDLRVQPG